MQLHCLVTNIIHGSKIKAPAITLRRNVLKTCRKKRLMMSTWRECFSSLPDLCSKVNLDIGLSVSQCIQRLQTFLRRSPFAVEPSAIPPRMRSKHRDNVLPSWFVDVINTMFKVRDVTKFQSSDQLEQIHEADQPLKMKRIS